MTDRETLENVRVSSSTSTIQTIKLYKTRLEQVHTTAGHTLVKRNTQISNNIVQERMKKS